ncbi:hypothetical protein Slala02_41310 [Streptomyces lavendulae subsp. lavendulae]|nr:hypothetical protein Slala01_41700 [Streptomyces lavendulae subsp. lavendulae]GLX28311.1 hypothetical protein Slala02_41310 [Streptomyces lavendulae subsp. lavendulae]
MRRSFECRSAGWLSGDRPGSALTSDNSKNLTDLAHLCQPLADRRSAEGDWPENLTCSSRPRVYAGPHDYARAHAQPSLVGRLTAADPNASTHALTAATTAAVSVSPPREWLGRRRGGHGTTPPLTHSEGEQQT